MQNALTIKINKLSLNGDRTKNLDHLRKDLKLREAIVRDIELFRNQIESKIKEYST